ncbi:MAG: winged helix-turn-helix transcriptional regulator [Geminicoccaceae bacterium]|nr:winged helix-turn-helix transcriptional regulator [Geminicoccaceae bacterium]MCB9942266.1 winged helix-turn-helix transcriptional regulator [Geminicoccaceae bacterium]
MVGHTMLKESALASRFLKSIANEHRLQILCTLSQGERSVGEIRETVELRQSNLSQQLGRLRQDKLVKTRREGKMIYYSLSNDKVIRVLDLLYELFCKDEPDPQQGRA